jgi:hypothetical protein
VTIDEMHEQLIANAKTPAEADALREAARWGRRVRIVDARGMAAAYVLAGKYDDAQQWLDVARELDAGKRG